MVEEKLSSPENTSKQKPTAPITLTQGLRPKPAYLWTISEVQKWFKRHCGEFFEKYSSLFLKVNRQFISEDRILTYCILQHEITGQALIRITDNTLLRIGIQDDSDREFIMREICKQKLKTDIVDFRDLESKNAHYDI